MLTAIGTAQRLDWKGWLLGITSAFVSGGAGAVSALVGISYVGGQDPDGFIMQGRHMLAVAGICFIFSAVVSLAKYLQIHPVPQIGPNLIADDTSRNDERRC